MANESPRFILGSASPRRSEILRALGLSFEVCPADMDESAVTASSPWALATRLALMKAGAVVRSLRGNAPSEESRIGFVLSFDTIVVLNDEILGKPEGPQNAADMLSRLSAREHEVISGCCIHRLEADESWIHAERTRVKFRALSPAAINAYVASGSPLDKAGAYGIQDHGDDFPLIERIDGDYWNVVGLPIECLREGFAAFDLSCELGPTPASPVRF